VLSKCRSYVDEKTARVLTQDSAHRRGLVLGLTMAEIMVLILFILLLILAGAMKQHKDEAAKKEKVIKEQAERIAQLVLLEKLLADLLSKNPTGVTIDDILQQIKRQEETIVHLEAEIKRLAPFETSGKALETIIQEISRETHEEPNVQQIADKMGQVAQLIKDNDTLRGQNAQLSRQIKASGRGNEFPSCWVTPDGKTESIFELLISDTGIRIIDRPLPHRVEDKARLPLSGVRYDEELPLHEFETALLPLYHWSVDHHCRFYVIIASSEYTAPIYLVNAVNGFFYPDSKIQFRPIVR